MKYFIFVIGLLISPIAFAMDIHDGHIHYNSDIWKELSPQQAIELLDENNINRAIVSSTPEAGTKKLFHLAPDRIIPFLRPYRVLRDRFTWHGDENILHYVEAEIKTGFYKGFGEFHLFKANKHSVIVQKMMQLVADYKLVVSAHSDGETIEALIDMQPQVKLIWAHCGFDHPVDDVQRMLDQYANLYCDLSFRDQFTDINNVLIPAWKTLLEKHPHRFITGMDTYISRRWANLPELRDYADNWLKQLSVESQLLIGKNNIEQLFPETQE